MNDASVKTYTSPVTAGNFEAGAVSVTFIFSSDFTGTIEGQTFAGSADSSLTFRAEEGERLSDIQYTITAGTLRIAAIR